MKKTNYEKELRRALLSKNKQLCLETIANPKGDKKKVSSEYIQACEHVKGMQALVNEIKTTIPNFTTADIKQWDNIEIEAITMDWYKDKKGEIKFDCHRTDEPDEIYFWSVYLHRVDGGVQCVADVHTEKEAKDLANLLKYSVINYKDNGFMKADEKDF